ncbi:phage major capsid protein [Bacillus sp. ISL-7]|uniref:phage major capsid protein n=1 Tax=Bacillus sp. ISL-7 TaxID=2819136 RepID=UPI001BE7820C|nr:phage major capsid protein [Bacillus sp. ISL-7]MBT2736159.1 phage major capsid protein [Bacillus sp. ISL-7]
MKQLIKKVETRSMPTLVEQRNNLLDEMEGLVNKSKAETRSFTDEESNRFDDIKKEIAKIDKTLVAEEESRAFEKKEIKKVNADEEQRALEVGEEKRFLEFVKGDFRALDAASNGSVIPTIIANKIIDKVRELSPIYTKTTIYNVGGDLQFPVYDYTQHTSSYATEFTDLTVSGGTFTNVKLTSFVIGSLAKVSRSLMNRSDFDVLSYIVNAVAKSIADFLEKELIVGTAGKMTGVLSAPNGVQTATVATLVADDIIDLQMTVPEVYQAQSAFLMHKNTLKALRKLKDANGQYILNADVTQAFGFSLLGKPVYISESMPSTIATGNKAIAYGDLSGLYVKLSQNVEVQVLNELYAAQHAVGIAAFVEADSKIVEPQKLAVLTVK